MSVAIKAARYGSQGGLRGHVSQGGLLGSIGGALKKVAGVAVNLLPGPIGAVGRMAVQAVSQRSPAATAAVMPGVGVMPMAPGFTIGGGASSGAGLFPGGGGFPVGTNLPGLSNAAARLIPGGNTGRGSGCMSGYHPNKSGYFTMRDGYIAPYSRCVRNRRKNPLNPRALSHAMSRLSSTGRALKSLGFKAPTAKGLAQHGKKRRRRK